jgi:hypothetical protein
MQGSALTLNIRLILKERLESNLIFVFCIQVLILIHSFIYTIQNNFWNNKQFVKLAVVLLSIFLHEWVFFILTS